MKITQVRHDLESSKILTHDLKMQRSQRQLAAKLTNAEGFVQGKPHMFEVQ